MRYFHLVLSLLFASITVSAQVHPYIYGESHVVAPILPTRTFAAKPAGTPSTLTITAATPFYDDFSSTGQAVDTNRWFVSGNNREPLQYRRGVIDNPTLGVATFDGLNSKGQPYNLVYGIENTDELVSHYLDISAFQPADSVILSFYLSEKGKGAAPTQADSFFVSVRDNTGNWGRVFAKEGGSGFQPFRKYFIPLTQTDLFHPEFQIRFERYGIACNHTALWHLDYVFLGANRSVLDSSHSDLAIVGLPSSLLHPFTSIPYQQFQGKTLIQPTQLSIHNLKNSTSSFTLENKITDPVGNSIFTSGNIDNATLSIPNGQFSAYTFNSFNDQILNPPSSSYLLTCSLPVDIDGTGTNNRIEELYRVDSLFGYDDGEADASYGLTGARGFGQKFDISSPDWVEAVWIHFAPTVHYNTITQQSTFLDQQPFRLTLWTTNHPDSILIQQTNNKVTYSDTLHTFIRYKLLEPQLVSGDVWVGLEQTDDKPIGVGFDKDYDNHTLVGWDSASHWVHSQIPGTLMIQLEMRNQQFSPVGITPALHAGAFRTFPNPTETQNIQVHISEGVTHYNIEIKDLQGRAVFQQSIQNPSEHIEIILPPLPTGIYILHHYGTSPSHTELHTREKLWIRN